MYNVYTNLGRLGDTNVPVLQPTLTTAASAGGGVAIAAVAGTSLAVPLIGAAIAGVTLLIGIWVNKNKVYHAQESATTTIVNQAETYLKQNVAAWNSSDKTAAEQQQAISNFNTIWGQVVQACLQQQLGDSASNPGGNPGTRCIEDRMTQGMTITYNGQTYTGNGKYDWFSYYLTPISSYVQPQPQLSVSGASNIINDILPQSFTPSTLDILMGVLLIGGAMFFMSDK